MCYKNRTTRKATDKVAKAVSFLATITRHGDAAPLVFRRHVQSPGCCPPAGARSFSGRLSCRSQGVVARVGLGDERQRCPQLPAYAVPDLSGAQDETNGSLFVTVCNCLLC